MIKEAIVKIVNKEDLTYDEAYTVMNEIMRHRMPHSLRLCLPKAPERKQQMKSQVVRRRCEHMLPRWKPGWSSLKSLELEAIMRTASIFPRPLRSLQPQAV